MDEISIFPVVKQYRLCETGWISTIKNAINVTQKRAILKNICKTNVLFFNYGEIELKKNNV